MNKTQRLFDKNSYAVTRGHDFVEINGVKWATCNLGAENPEDPGMFFRWGDNKGVYIEDLELKGDKFCSRRYDIEPFGHLWENDPAHVMWGGKWRMPTQKECRSLFAVNSINLFDTEVKVKPTGIIRVATFAENGKELWLPRWGFTGLNHCDTNQQACFWTKEEFDIDYAYSFNILSDNRCLINGDSKYFGLSIRPVLDV